MDILQWPDVVQIREDILYVHTKVRWGVNISLSHGNVLCLSLTVRMTGQGGGPVVFPQ